MHMSIDVSMCVYVCVCVCVDLPLYGHVRVYMYVYMHVRVCLCMCVCVHARVLVSITYSVSPDPGQCLPGTFSPDGLELCETCPVGSYQSQYASKSCVPCPNGTTTWGRGARQVTKCGGKILAIKSSCYILTIHINVKIIHLRETNHQNARVSF